MPGFKMRSEDGSILTYTAKIFPFLTHEQSKPKYQGRASFEITEMRFQTSIGTYLDSPYHRYPNKRDISQILLDEVVLNGSVIDVREMKPFQSVPPGVITKNHNDSIGKAVLFNFGWDQYWGTDKYYKYPFISKELINRLLEQKVKLIGVDTINIDDSRDLSRPAHSIFLANDILIVENLRNLNTLHNRKFRFYAVPIKGRKVAAMPVRAFAEILP
jgi:arylformamidase